MKANEILKMDVTTVSNEIAYAFFCEFSKHYGLTDEEEAKALADFDELKKMNISLDLALITAISVSKF